MWNVYSLIKSGAINPQIWESPFDREMREAEEKREKILTEIAQSIPDYMRDMESNLEKLGSCLSDEELFNVGNKIDMDSRDIAMRIPMLLISRGKLVNEIYDKAILLIKKSGELFKQYPAFCFDIFAKSSKIRVDYLTEDATKYQPELIKGE